MNHERTLILNKLDPNGTYAVRRLDAHQPHALVPGCALQHLALEEYEIIRAIDLTPSARLPVIDGKPQLSAATFLNLHRRQADTRDAA